jgi:hypothetical protein
MQLLPIAVLAIMYSKDCGPTAQRSNRNAPAAQFDAKTGLSHHMLEDRE